MHRYFWLVFGAATHILFFATVARLFPFLESGGQFRGLLAPEAPRQSVWFWTDGLLAVQFSVLHSGLLVPRVRKALGVLIPPPQYGCFFCTATCLSLLVTIEFWQPSLGAVWRLHGPVGGLVSGAFYMSWAALLYSLSLTGLGYQTGWTPWWAWVRGREQPKRAFAPRGAYRVLRHPVYLSFLGLVWLNRAMTFDRLCLALVWTGHIFLGSYLKDRRLVYYVGEAYRRYQTRVPGYPFVFWGPLGKRSATR
jgi:protein-S-isoprenylcysteine O-methyltransferase Ste14